MLNELAIERSTRKWWVSFETAKRLSGGSPKRLLELIAEGLVRERKPESSAPNAKRLINAWDCLRHCNLTVLTNETR